MYLRWIILHPTIWSPVWLKKTDFSKLELLSKLADGNTTASFAFNRHVSRFEYEGKGCYFAPETKYLQTRISIFSGFEGWKLYKAMGRLTDAGIIWKYDEFHYFLIAIKFKSQEEHFLFVESQPKAFVMSDMKITSIFVVWIFLVGLACVIFIVEYSREKVIRTLNSVISELVRGTQFVRNFELVYFWILLWRNITMPLCQSVNHYFKNKILLSTLKK